MTRYLVNNEGAHALFMRMVEEARLPSRAKVGADNLSGDDSSDDSTSTHSSMPSLIGQPGHPQADNSSNGSSTFDPTMWSGSEDEEDECPMRGLVRILDERKLLLGRINQEEEDSLADNSVSLESEEPDESISRDADELLLSHDLWVLG